MLDEAGVGGGVWIGVDWLHRTRDSMSSGSGGQLGEDTSSHLAYRQVVLLRHRPENAERASPECLLNAQAEGLTFPLEFASPAIFAPDRYA